MLGICPDYGVVPRARIPTLGSGGGDRQDIVPDTRASILRLTGSGADNVADAGKIQPSTSGLAMR